MLNPLSLLKPYEPYVWAAAAVAILFGSLALVHHIEQIGAQQEIAKVEAARAAEHIKVVQETADLQAKADKAAEERDAKQNQLDAYMATHPVGAVFVCSHTNSSKPAGVPASTKADPGIAVPSAGSAVVPPVLAGGTGVNIGPALDTLVRAAGAVAGLYQQSQSTVK